MRMYRCLYIMYIYIYIIYIYINICTKKGNHDERAICFAKSEDFTVSLCV